MKTSYSSFLSTVVTSELLHLYVRGAIWKSVLSFLKKNNFPKFATISNDMARRSAYFSRSKLRKSKLAETVLRAAGEKS